MEINQTQNLNPWKQHPSSWGYLTVLMVLVAIAYWPSLDFGFVWDDHPLVVDNPLLKQSDNLLKIFFHNFWDVGGRTDTFRHFYRPLTTFSYWLNHRWFGEAAAGYHAFNLAVHLAATALAFLLAQRLLGAPVWAFAAGVFFGLHPTHVENVAWISGRTDLLAAVFSLAAITAWLKAEDSHSRGWSLAGTLLMFCGLLSKEVAVMAPLAWLLFAAPKSSTQRILGLSRERISTLSGAAAVLLLYFGIRLSVLGVVASNASFPGIEMFSAALGHVMTAYLRLSLFAVAVDPHYFDLQFKLMVGATAWFGWILLLGHAALTWLAWRQRQTWGKFYMLYLVFLAPVFALGSFGDVLYADRFLYLPALGMGCLLAWGLRALFEQIRKRKEFNLERGAFVVLACVALYYTMGTLHASAVWRNDVTLFEQASKTSSDSRLVWNNLGLAYSYEGRWLQAERAFRKALQVDMEYGYGYHNLAVSLRKQNRNTDAAVEFLRAMALDPGDTLYMYNYAENLQAMGDYKGAEKWYKKILLNKPENYAARHNLGYLWMLDGKNEMARQAFMRAAGEQTIPLTPYNSLGILSARQGKSEEAETWFKKALALDPEYKKAKNNLQRLRKK